MVDPHIHLSASEPATEATGPTLRLKRRSMELRRRKVLVAAGIRDGQLLAEFWRRSDVGPRDSAQLLITVNLRERFRRPIVKPGYPSAKLRVLLRADLVHTSVRQIDDLARVGTVIPGGGGCAGRIQCDDLTAMAELVCTQLAQAGAVIAGRCGCAGRIQRDDLAALAELVRTQLANAVQTISLLRTMTLQQALRANIETGIALRNTETTTELDRGRRDDVRRLRKRNEFRLLRQFQGALRIGAARVFVIEGFVRDRRIFKHRMMPCVRLQQAAEQNTDAVAQRVARIKPDEFLIVVDGIFGQYVVIGLAYGTRRKIIDGIGGLHLGWRSGRRNGGIAEEIEIAGQRRAFPGGLPSVG